MLPALPPLTHGWEGETQGGTLSPSLQVFAPTPLPLLGGRGEFPGMPTWHCTPPAFLPHLQPLVLSFSHHQ